MNVTLDRLFNALAARSELARMRAEAARVDAEFAEQEMKARANLEAIRMRNQIDSSHRILAHESGASVPCVRLEQIPERFA